MTEPIKTINGITLTLGQAMTLRVAMDFFAMEMSNPDALGEDETGRAIRVGYYECLRQIRELLYRRQT